jgi:hypothetical protein
LAIGIGLAAVGLTEVSAVTPTRSPFTNGWFRAGLIVSLVGAVWVLGTFALAMTGTVRAARFHELLGHALNDGQRLAEQGASKVTITAWATQARDLIEASLGSAEARLFLGEWDLGEQFGGGPEGHLYLHRRLIRLSRLMDRMYATHVGPGQKLGDWVYRSSDPRETLPPGERD